MECKYHKPPLYLYFDTDTGKPRTNRAPNQPAQQYVNLKSLWHKPDETPYSRKGILIFNKDEELRITTLTNAACESWQSFTSFAHIQAWMYIDELYNTIPTAANNEPPNHLTHPNSPNTP